MARALADRYELEVLLGRGTTGEVWRGHDMATRKPVAVKIFKLEEIESAAAVAETIARFRREAATLARLRHPNIVAALEAGRIRNELFLVMELVEGISLASMLEQRMANNLGPLPVSSVLRIAEQTCTGLAAAHSAGVVHRDIKPSNLMVAANLSTKIIDFGIARLLNENASTVLTLHAVGTLAYISPEQLQNKDVDGRADLYSLGCLLYEQLAGRLPFEAEVPSALLVMHMRQRAVPLDSIRPDLPAGLARLVERLMEKDRSRRPADAAQVLRNIAGIKDQADRTRPAQEADRSTQRAASQPGGRIPEADRSTQRAPSQPGGRIPEADRSTQRAPVRPTDATTAGQAEGQRAQPSFVPRSAAPGAPARPTAPRSSSGRETNTPPPQAPLSAAYQATELFRAQGPQPGPGPRPDPPATSHRRRRSGWRGAVSTLIATITRARRRGERQG